MNGVKLCFSGTIALAVAVAIGCGTSSSQPSGGSDSGPDGDVGIVVDAGLDAGATHCNPVFGQLCSAGQTCCFFGLNGTCVDKGACSAPFQVSCIARSNCGSDVCCGSVQVPAGFDASGFDASDFDASGFDASGFDASGFGLTLQCASTCSAPDFLLCATSQDCPAGFHCSGGGDGGRGFGILACIANVTDAGLVDAGADAPGEPPDAGADAPADAGDGG